MHVSIVCACAYAIQRNGGTWRVGRLNVFKIRKQLTRIYNSLLINLPYLYTQLTHKQIGILHIKVHKEDSKKYTKYRRERRKRDIEREKNQLFTNTTLILYNRAL